MHFDRLVREFLDEEDSPTIVTIYTDVLKNLFRKTIDGDEGMADSLGRQTDRFTSQRHTSASISQEKDTLSKDADSPEQNEAKKMPWWLQILAHTQGLVTASTALGVLYLHRAHGFYYVGASLATSFIAKGLKHVIRQPRPPGAFIEKTSGMPSTHSSAVTFMSLYLVVALLLPLASQHMPNSAPNTPSLSALSPIKGTAIVALLAFPPLVMHSRVRLGLHTPAQCAVGATLGGICCAGFTTLWRSCLAQSRYVALIDRFLRAN